MVRPRSWRLLSKWVRNCPSGCAQFATVIIIIARRSLVRDLISFTVDLDYPCHIYGCTKAEDIHRNESLDSSKI